MKANQTSITRYLAWIALGVCFLVGVVLSLKNLREPDTWWMLKTGEWITQNGVPTVDVFSYTHDGQPWINVKWGFEVIIYFFSKIGGPQFVLVFQAIIYSLLFYWLYRASKSMRFFVTQIRVTLPSVGFLVAGLFFWLMVQYRMVGRPEMISHFFTGLFCYLLIRYRHSQDRKIWLLLLAQVLWVNLHEAYGTGIVILFGFTILSWIEYFIDQKFNLKLQTGKPKILTYISLLSIPLLAIHPYGYKMILHPLEIYRQLGTNKFTSELFSVTHPKYWEVESYLFIGFAIISVLLLFVPNKKTKVSWWLRPVKQFGLGYIGLLAAFVFLGLTAYRNIPFFAIWATPLLAFGLEELYTRSKQLRLAKRFKPATLSNISYGKVIILGLVFYGLVGSNTFYETLDKRDEYGLEVNQLMNPVGAANFVNTLGVEGRCFSDLLISSYLLWSIPNFKTYIDFRDLDVFPAEFFDHFAKVSSNPYFFQQEDSIYNFNYVILYRLQYTNLHYYLVQSPDYELVYADGVAAVYLKNNETNQQLISEYGYSKKQGDLFTIINPDPELGVAYGVSKLLWPPYQAHNYVADYDQDLIAASFYSMIGNLPAAFEYSNLSLASKKELFKSYEMLGSLSIKQIGTVNNDQEKIKLTEQAMAYYGMAIKDNPEKATEAYLGLGVIYTNSGNYTTGIEQFDLCIKHDPHNYTAHLYAAECYKRIAAGNNFTNKDHLESWAGYLQNAIDLNDTDALMLLNLGIVYCHLNDCDKARKYLKRSVDLPGLNQQDVEFGKACLERCGN